MTALKTQGTTIGVGDGASPEVFSNVGEVKDINWQDAGGTEIDVTNLSSTSKEFIMGLPDNGSVALVCNYDPNDTPQSTLKTSKDAQTLKNYKVTLSDASTTFTFAAYVMNWSVTLTEDDRAVLNVSLKISGDVTVA